MNTSQKFYLTFLQMSELVSWELVQLRIWLMGFVLATGQTLLCLHEQTENVCAVICLLFMSSSSEL